MCSARAERDVPLGRDVCSASDVPFGREAEHITSLCAKGALHHFGEADAAVEFFVKIHFLLAICVEAWYYIHIINKSKETLL